MGGAIAGHSEPVAKVAMEIINRETGTSKCGAASLATTARNAAFVNGTLAHAHDIDDTNPSMRGHPSCPVVPAIFALAPLAHS